MDNSFEDVTGYGLSSLKQTMLIEVTIKWLYATTILALAAQARYLLKFVLEGNFAFFILCFCIIQGCQKYTLRTKFIESFL